MLVLGGVLDAGGLLKRCGGADLSERDPVNQEHVALTRRTPDWRRILRLLSRASGL